MGAADHTADLVTARHHTRVERIQDTVVEKIMGIVEIVIHYTQDTTNIVTGGGDITCIGTIVNNTFVVTIAGNTAHIIAGGFHRTSIIAGVNRGSRHIRNDTTHIIHTCHFTVIGTTPYLFGIMVTSYTTNVICCRNNASAYSGTIEHTGYIVAIVTHDTTNVR